MTVAVFLVSLLGSMAIGLPVAFSLIVCALALMLHMGIFDSQIVAMKLIEGADNFQLLALPFFLLAGELMNAGGLSKRIVDFAVSLVGHLKGGLGYVAICAAVILSALSGSAAADTAAIAAILIPMMRKARYNMPRSAGLIASSGVIGPVIPPSGSFIVFGVAANVSIIQLFLAGIFPGILLAIAMSIAWWIVARRDDVATLPRESWATRGKALVDGFFALLMPVIILGCIKFGWATPTEAGVFAAVYALLVGAFIYRELKWRDLYAVFLASAKTTAVIMFLVAAALISAWLIAQANIPADMGALLEGFKDNPKVLLAMMMVLVIVVGTALDSAPTILILTPILMPLVREAGINEVYFGVLFIINNAIGLITPPVGVVLNVVSGVAKVPMSAVIRGVWPFFVAQTTVLFLLVAFPQWVIAPLMFLRDRIGFVEMLQRMSPF